MTRLGTFIKTKSFFKSEIRRRFAVTPFSATDEWGAPPLRGGADGGGRILPCCENCWAYFSTYCDLENWAWTCALCGNYHSLASDSIKRFFADCPELSSSFVDLELEPTGGNLGT